MFTHDFARLEIFQGMSADQIDLLQPLMEMCDFSKDCCVFGQDDPAKYIYIIVRGEVEMRYKPYDGPEIGISRLSAGGVFGWSSALGKTAYSSKAVCIKDTVTYRLKGKSIQRLCEQNPETGQLLLERLARHILERGRDSSNQIRNFLSKGVESDVDEPRSR